MIDDERTERDDLQAMIDGDRDEEDRETELDAVEHGRRPRLLTLRCACGKQVGAIYATRRGFAVTLRGVEEVLLDRDRRAAASALESGGVDDAELRAMLRDFADEPRRPAEDFSWFLDDRDKYPDFLTTPRCRRHGPLAPPDAVSIRAAIAVRRTSMILRTRGVSR